MHKISQFLLAGACVLATCCGAFAASGNDIGSVISLPAFGKVKLVDMVDCTKPDADHGFIEYPAGASRVEKILDRDCRVMPITAEEDGSYFGYRMGKDRGMKPNTPYVLVIEYPEDVSRSWLVRNGANWCMRGFYTGQALGDAYWAKYVDGHCESLDIPLSKKYKAYTCEFFLNDVVSANNSDKIKLVPAKDGFDIVLAQFGRKHAPISAGVAARSIRVYEVLDEKTAAAPVVLPPAGLPQRHLFWREEMSDGAIQGKDHGESVLNRIDWFEHKARMMKFLGMNTYAKDLLEFGAVQHWDPNFVKQGWIWDDGSTKDVWGQVVDLMGKYGFWILPYYEYCGGLGPEHNGQKCLGAQKRAQTLGGQPNYTHVWWVEKADADITDPETMDDFKLVIDGTVLRFKDKAKFLGVWFRPRQMMPIGFGDATRERFAKEENGGKAVSRHDLQSNRDLYNKYIDWWGKKRAAWCVVMRDYMREKGVAGAEVLFTNCGAEPGPGPADCGDIFADDKAAWDKLLRGAPWNSKDPKVHNTAEVVSNHLYLKGMKSPGWTWGKWEWQHCSPADDPQHYTELEGVYLAHPFNRLYTVSDPESFREYTNKDGGQAIIRHHSLNENMVFKTVTGKDGKKGEDWIVGYVVADMERAGRASMQSEVVAMANGNPYMIGYLCGSVFGRGFPVPAREFNCNYLALPALPSKVVPGACDDPQVVLREIDAGAAKYFAVVYTGSEPKSVTVKFPSSVRGGTFIVDGKSFSGSSAKIDFLPWQLLAVRAK